MADGRVVALEADLYNNAGNSLDLSHSVMDRALLHSDGVYKIPHVRVRGHLCRTHQVRAGAGAGKARAVSSLHGAVTSLVRLQLLRCSGMLCQADRRLWKRPLKRLDVCSESIQLACLTECL